MIDALPLDRRSFIAALVCASIAPHWPQRLLHESQSEAARRLARCSVQIADELIAALEPAPFPAGVPVTNPNLDDF